MTEILVLISCFFTGTGKKLGLSLDNMLANSIILKKKSLFFSEFQKSEVKRSSEPLRCNQNQNDEGIETLFPPLTKKLLKISQFVMKKESELLFFGTLSILNAQAALFNFNLIIWFSFLLSRMICKFYITLRSWKKIYMGYSFLVSDFVQRALL